MMTLTIDEHGNWDLVMGQERTLKFGGGGVSQSGALRVMGEMTSAQCARAVTAINAVAPSKVCHRQPQPISLILIEEEETSRNLANFPCGLFLSP